VANKNSWLGCFLLLVVGLSACNNSDLSPRAYQDFIIWMQQESNGLRKIRSRDRLTMSAQYLPAQYLAHKQVRSNATENIDSLLVAYQKSTQILFSLEPTQLPNVTGLIEHEVYSREEYAARINMLSFQMGQFFTLTVNEQVYAPVGAHFDGVNNQAKALKFTLVFNVAAATLATEEKVDLRFDDPIWGMGINHFVFQPNQLKNIPEIIP